MPNVLVDAGPLITLGKLNRLGLLGDLYDRVLVPRSVFREVVIAGSARGAPDALTVRLFLAHVGWPILEASPEVIGRYSPSVILDSGERELLALAQTLPEVLVLLDDEVARNEARRLGLPARGTLGVLVQAYRAGLLTLDEIELLLLEIGARPDIWISEKLCKQVWTALST